MKDKKLINLRKELKIAIRSVRLILLGFLAIMIILILGGVSFSFYIPSLTVFWFLTTYPFLWLAERQKSIDKINNIHFGYFIVEFLILTVMIHFIGGIETIGAIFYVFFLVYAVFFLSQKRGVLITLFAFLFYTTLAFLEYSGIIPHCRFVYPNSYQDLSYVLTSVLLVGVTFGSLFLVAEYFAKKLRERNKKLTVLYKKLREETEILEKINKISEGRELRMIELKKEIKELKEKLKKFNE